MVIALIALWSYLSVMYSDDPNKPHERVTMAKIKKELLETTETPLPYGVSIFGNYNENFSVYSLDNSNLKLQHYGVKLDYQLYQLVNIYFRASESILSGNINGENEKYTGETFSIGSLVSYNYKSLYYGKDVYASYSHFRNTDDFYRLVYAPRLGYITKSKKFKIWGGLSIGYQNHEFDLDSHFIFVPSLGMEYQFTPSFIVLGEVYTQGPEDLTGVTVKTTYRF